MQIYTSLFVTLLPLLSFAEEQRLGASHSNYESVGTGRIFTSDPEPPIDRSRLLQEVSEEMNGGAVIPEVAGGNTEEAVVVQPITRRLRRIGVDKKRDFDKEVKDTSVEVSI